MHCKRLLGRGSRRLSNIVRKSFPKWGTLLSYGIGVLGRERRILLT
jgi:hypothetical protein